MKKLLLLAAIVALGTGSGMAQNGAQGQGQQGQGQGGRGRGGQNQNRDPAQTPVPATATITGRVTTADSGRGAKHAQVFVTGNGRGGHSVVTDEQGRYVVANLPAGTYTVTATKNGYVQAIYGQRRPLQPGTPVQLADAQQLSGIDMRIIRGGVITGRVSDEDGEPLTRAMVSVQRYQYVRGERTLTAAGGDQTDDRGIYRVFGLAPGVYFVSATATEVGGPGGRGIAPLVVALGAGGRGGRGGFATPEPEANGYAPTYYPGASSTAEAGKLTVAPGQELTGIDFQIQLVPFATVSGVVSGADGPTPVMLVQQDSGAAGRLATQMLTGRMMEDGTFQITNVPPGHYTAIARSGGGRQNDPKVAVQNLVVNGQNIDGVTLMLQPGVAMSGNITVESSGTPSPTDYSGFRIDAPEVSPLPGGFGPFGGGRGAGAGGRAQTNGAFQVPNLMPGQHYVTVTGQAQGGTWYLKSVIANGQDVSDSSVELKPGQNLDGVTIVLTDRVTNLSGTVRDSGGNPAAAVTVIAFSADPQYWRAQSRRIQSARSDATGVYHVRGLPPGDYLLVAVDDAENGEWFDPAYLDQVKASATHVTLAEGDTKTLDLRGPPSGS